MPCLKKMKTLIISLSEDRMFDKENIKLSRIKPQNVCAGDIFPTLNTRYEEAAVKDYITLRHFPKGCWIYVYENS